MKYKYLSTNMASTRITTKLHEVGTNLQFVAYPDPTVKLLNKNNTALAKTSKTTYRVEIS